MAAGSCIDDVGRASRRPAALAYVSRGTYTYVMDTISRNVDELAGPDREALEHMIGRPLELDQQVLIAVVRKGDKAALSKAAARARILATLERASQHAPVACITETAADAVVAEAMAAVRPRAGSP
jgi:hypothetical protein